jgi:DNA-binding XRE family transcriptional regulator
LIAAAKSDAADLGKQDWFFSCDRLLRFLLYAPAGPSSPKEGRVLRLTFERHRQKLSQQTVAQRADLAQTIVSAIERGRVNPTSRELDAIARVLGVADPAVLLHPVQIQEEEGVARG